MSGREIVQSYMRLLGLLPSKNILLNGLVGLTLRFPSRILRMAWSRSPLPTPWDSASGGASDCDDESCAILTVWWLQYMTCQKWTETNRFGCCVLARLSDVGFGVQLYLCIVKLQGAFLHFELGMVSAEDLELYLK